MKMTCDNDCTMAGWIEYMAYGPDCDLHISIAPDSDLDGVVLAFCHDDQEMLKVNGWAFSFERI